MFRFLKTLPCKYPMNCCEQVVLKNASPIVKYKNLTFSLHVLAPFSHYCHAFSKNP